MLLRIYEQQFYAKLFQLNFEMDNKMSEALNPTFDKGVSYSEAYNLFTGEIKRLNDIQALNYKENIKLVYLSISLIQLQNGSRIIETLKAVKLFTENKDAKSVIVTIAKRKDGYKRKILLPEIITTDILERIERVLEKYSFAQLSKNIRMFLHTNYDWNTHSLRYALINYLAIEKKIPINLVSKLVGHKHMNQLLAYTQNKHVDELLMSLNKNIL